MSDIPKWWSSQIIGKFSADVWEFATIAVTSAVIHRSVMYCFCSCTISTVQDTLEQTFCRSYPLI